MLGAGWNCTGAGNALRLHGAFPDEEYTVTAALWHPPGANTSDWRLELRDSAGVFEGRRLQDVRPIPQIPESSRSRSEARQIVSSLFLFPLQAQRRPDSKPLRHGQMI